MPPYLLLSIVVFVLLVLAALVVIAVRLRTSGVRGDPASRQLHPQGYWVSIGISIGAGLGVALGKALDQLPLGIAVGAAIGAAVGAALEEKNKDSMRQPTAQEQNTRSWALAVSVVLGAALLAFFVFLTGR